MAALTRRTAHDVDDQAEALAGWDQHYEQLSCGRFRGELWHMVMQDGFLLREQTNRQLREQIAPPPDHVVLALPLAVQPGSVYAGRALDRDTLICIAGGAGSSRGNYAACTTSCASSMPPSPSSAAST